MSVASTSRAFVIGVIFGCLSVQSAVAQKPKAASQPAYVGAWSVDPARCKAGQEEEGAPLVVAAKRLDQHEAHCEFRSVRPADAAHWAVQATCTVEGNVERRRIALALKDGRLSVSWGDGVTTTYQRCAPQ